MCGIFGFSYFNQENSNDLSKVENDINLFTKLNKIRGSDTFGLSISSKKENFIYKINTDPTTAIKRKDYKSFLETSLNDIKHKNEKNVSVIGQTRLVTNGTKFLYANNQPIITKYITGVHNGIIVNSKKEETTKTVNLEGYNIKSDSLEFFENLDSIKANIKNFFENYLEYLKKVIGNYSIAFKLLDSSKIIISSNCGSLYYFFDEEKKIFLFSSEKNFLVKFLENSKILKIFKVNKKNSIEKVLNQSIIFDEKERSIKKLSHHKNTLNNLSNISLQNHDFKIIDNFSENEKKLKNLKKCNKCILPETYPFIRFDEKGICNFCNAYEKQEFKGDAELLKVLDKHRSKDGQPDCLVGLSGGRDSSYGLHF